MIPEKALTWIKQNIWIKFQTRQALCRVCSCVFDIAVSGKVLRNYGSRGQCRISALSMKLAELELISEQFGSFTVIVDDAFSDLDIPAKEAFLRRVSKAEQIYYAFTELPVEKEFEGANIITLGENA